jgi:hypothetical protein
MLVLTTKILLKLVKRNILLTNLPKSTEFKQVAVSESLINLKIKKVHKIFKPYEPFLLI